MSYATKKKIILFFVIPMIFSVIFYQQAAAVFVKIFIANGAPAPELKTLLSYCFSLLLDCAEIDFFAFDFPAEFATELNNLYPNLGGVIRPARLFRYAIDDLNTPALRRVYTFFPYYFSACFIAFFGLASYKAADTSAEEKAKNQRFLRGVKRVSSAVFCKQSKSKVKDPVAVLATDGGNIFLSDVMLRQHSLILGSTGTGKSQLLISLVKSFVQNSRARLVFVDRKGEFYSLFGTSKDTLIHPHDRRGVAWDLFNEIDVELEDGLLLKPPSDVEAIAQLLFKPERQKENADWYKKAAAVFVSACCWCITNGKTSNRDLCRFMQSSVKDVMDKLGSLPEDCRAGRAVLGDDPKSKGAGSIMSIANGVVMQLSHFSEGPFSVREWTRNSKTGNLYISTAGRNDNTFSDVVTLLIDLIGREIKEFPDDGGQRTKMVFVLDELGALPPLDTLKFLLTQARSKGIACILANQTFSKIRSVYGDAEARDLLANTKSRYFFSVPEAGDAEYISKLLGTAEVERTVESENSSRGSSIFGRMDERAGKNINKQIVQEACFLPGTIESLEVGQAIVQQAALPGIVAMVRFKRVAEQQKINAEYEPIKHDTQSAKAYATIKNLEQQAAATETQDFDILPLPMPDEDIKEAEQPTENEAQEEQKKPAVSLEKESDDNSSTAAKEPPPAEPEASHQREAAADENDDNDDEAELY